VSTRELQHTPHRSSATADTPIHFANASRYQVLTDVSGYHCMANGHCTILVTRRVNEGATVHAPSLIRTADTPILFANASRYQGLTDVSGYHCMANGHVASSVTRSVNEPLVTRRVNEGATVHAPSPISTAGIPILLANATRYHGLTDVSGYHCMANGHVASSVTRSVNEQLVTRRVNEGATVHAPSPIRHGRYPDPLR
jgi:acetyltransferase-like isoleucine patch superfamily enzyme